MRVPEWQNRTSRPTVSLSTPQELRPPPEAFGGGVAEALQNLGETGQKIAGLMVQRAAERRKELMAKQVFEQDTMFRQEMQNVLYNDQVDKNGKPLGFLSRKLDQTQNITPEFDQVYSNIKKKYLNNMVAPEQKDTLARMLDSTYLSHRDNIIRHERNQIDQGIQNSFKSNLDIQVNDAAQLQDGPSVIRAIDAAIVTQDTLSKINGYDEKTAEVQRIDVRGKVTKTAFSSAMAENNLIKAQSIYNAVKGKIPAEIEEKMKEQVESGIPYGIAIQDAFLDPISTRKKLETNAYDIKDPVKRKAAYDFTNTLADKMITDSQETRHNELLDNLAKGTLTLIELENAMQIPEELGGIPKKTLKTYYEATQRGIQKDLNRWLEEGGKNDPTPRAKDVNEYVQLIGSFISDDVDKWHAREKLAEAYADGIVNSQEALFLNKLKTSLRNVEANRSRWLILDNVRGFVNKLKGYNASDEEITLRVKQLLGTLSQPGKVPQDEAKIIMQDHLRSKIPEIDTLPAKGQLMMDVYGNKAIVYPDGTIEPIQKNKEKPKTEEQK